MTTRKIDWPALLLLFYLAVLFSLGLFVVRLYP